MNSNGNTRKTATIAFNAYQRCARSNQPMQSLHPTAESEPDEIRVQLSHLLFRVFQTSSNQHHSTAEQETAKAWEKSQAALRNGSVAISHSSGLTLNSGRLCTLDVMTQVLIQIQLRKAGVLAV
jgi:hypothetical protein